MPKESSCSRMYNRAQPFLAVVLMQLVYAGNSIISKWALNKGMSQHVLVVYRNAIATVFIAPFAIVLDRKIRPKMTLSIFVKIVLLGLLEPVIDGNLFYTGMKLTTATFSSAMCNILPAFAFIMALIFKLEKVDIRRLHSQAKILGTIVTVGGAMIMTLVNGPVLNFPWTRSVSHYESSSSTDSQDPIKGALMITAGCFSWASFVILQAVTLKSYPVALSLTAWICFMGALQGSMAALAFEWHNPAAWDMHLDSKLLAPVYSGLMSSGVNYYIQGMIMKQRGPVFVTAFNPLGMIIVAVLSSIALSEILYIGRVMGAMVIVTGLYMVLWGKSKDHLLSDSDADAETEAEADEDKVATTV